MTTTRKVRRRAPTGELARYLEAPYVRMIIPNAEEGGYLAEVLELPGCITDGDTLEEAYRNLQEAMAGWIEASLENGRPIPDPLGDKDYSGHFPLRMSTELHRVAALRAMQEGVSLNQWIAAAVTEKVAKEDLANALADKIAPKVVEQLSVKVSTEVSVRLGEIKSEATDFARVMRAQMEPSMEETAEGTYGLVEASLAGKLRETPWAREFLQPYLTPWFRDILGRSPSRSKGGEPKCLR